MAKNRKVCTHKRLSTGKEFPLYGDFRFPDYKLGEIVDLWFERERDGLGDEIIYGQAKITALPIHRTGLYTAIVL